MQKTFFLDLEQTVIETWSSPDLIYVDQLRRWLKYHDATEVHIFSFAIWNEADKKAFVDRGIKASLEAALGVAVMTWPCVEEMMKADTALTHTRYEDIGEFVGLRGKKDGFRNYVRSKGIQHAVLVDDVVPDETIINRKYGTTVEYWNVDTVADMHYQWNQ